MPRVALLSVGNIAGKSEVPVNFFLASVKPDIVYLFVSEDSRGIAENIISQTYLDPKNVNYLHLPDPLSINSCYEVVCEAFADAVKKNPKAWYSIDLTTGTKPMAFALMLRTFQLLDDEEIDGRFNISYTRKTDDENEPMLLCNLPDKRLAGGEM
ncbi:MAG TPA: hypothetical protein ENK21_06490 [Trueperaceae bacterium]|nr:hypothetical protein [Trueperaceae bacterium]